MTNYMINRKRASEGREDLLPQFFIWTMLRTCNYRCEYCDDHRGNKYPDLSNRGVLDTDRAMRLLEVMRTRTPSLYLAGGEPTLRKDLPALTRYARDLGYYPITINTNGSVLHKLLERERWRTWLADTDIIVVSLDALDLDLLEGMWSTRRPQDVLRNLLVLRELAEQMRVKLMVNTVIQPGRVRHAREVLDFANDMGIWFTPVPVNLGPRVDATLLAEPAYRALAALILARKRAGYRITGSERMNQRLLHAEPMRCRNTLKPHVDYDGRLLWPCKGSVAVDPIPIQVLDFDHVDDLYAYARAQRDPAGFHGQGEGQCGADCNWAQNYATDAYAHGLQNPMSLLREVSGYLRAS